MPIEELCARSLEKIGRAVEWATSSEIAGNTQNLLAIRRSMKTLSENTLRDYISCDGLDRVISILSEELDLETQAIVPSFDGYYDPEDGAVGTVTQERILTGRGEHVAQCLIDLRVLREMLLVLAYRFDAERIVNQHFGG